MANPLAHHTSRRTLSVLHRAFRFFLAHAGYYTPPGRAACALHLAKAERWSQDAGLYALWVLDDDADLSWMDDAERKLPHDIEGCILVRPCPCHADLEDYSYETFRVCQFSLTVRRTCAVHREGLRRSTDHDTIASCPFCDTAPRTDRCEQLVSLWDIVDATPQYRRVVEAELALEAMPESPLPIAKALIAGGY